MLIFGSVILATVINISVNKMFQERNEEIANMLRREHLRADTNRGIRPFYFKIVNLGLYPVFIEKVELIFQIGHHEWRVHISEPNKRLDPGEADKFGFAVEQFSEKDLEGYHAARCLNSPTKRTSPLPKKFDSVFLQIVTTRSRSPLIKNICGINLHQYLNHVLNEPFNFPKFFQLQGSDHSVFEDIPLIPKSYFKNSPTT